VSDIYHKTTKGQSEIESRFHSLSIQQRRLLILINGSNDTADLTRMSLCKNVIEILETLLAGDFIGTNGTSTTTVAARDYRSG
jgi:hypothetical protein